MRWKRGRQQIRGGIDLAEEAVFLLRRSPAPILASYLVGSVPFVLGLLYFWTDMSRSPFAAGHVGEAAFGMAALYIWMKFWHSIFSIRLLSGLTGEPLQKFSGLRIFRLVCAQLAVQPYSLFVVPFCMLAVLPMPWALAFFHTFSLAADGNHSNLRAALKRTWSLASRWQPQNHVFVFLMILLAFCTYIGIAISILLIPFLLDTLFGIESVFSRSGFAVMTNSTYLAVTAGLTYLCMNPIMKTAFVLRAFYGEALRTGADLQAELRSIEVNEERPASSRLRTAILSILMFGIVSVSASASSDNSKTTPPAPQQSIRVEKLDESIERVINQREYQWRLPRKEEDLQSENSFIADFLEGISNTIMRWLKPIGKALGDVWDWLIRKLFPKSNPPSAGESPEITDQTVLVAVLITAAVLLLGLLIFRIWKKRTKEEVVTAEVTTAAIPDLADESTIADQYPEDGWLALAREYWERGEMRLALRAFYLSSLSMLSGKGIITITRYKSNREYNRELQRKAQSNKELLDAFQENMVLFERSWYGEHMVSSEILNKFSQNQERMREVA